MGNFVVEIVKNAWSGGDLLKLAYSVCVMTLGGFVMSQYWEIK